MKINKIFLLLCLIGTVVFGTETVKISELPLGTASTTSYNDSFPYVDSLTVTTKRLRLYDIVNIPSFANTFATVASPTFTGGINLKDNTSGLSINLAAPNLSSGYNFKFPIGTGTNGYVLTTDGAGNTSWSVGPSASVSIGSPITSSFNWRVLITDGSAQLSQMPAGTAGYLLQSNGTNVSPTWVAPPAGAAIGSAVSGGSPWYSLYLNGSSQLSQLAPGTSGYLLQSNGSGSAPSWVAPPSSMAIGASITGASNYYSLYVNGSGQLGQYAPGTSGYLLQSNGPSAAPSWVAPPSGVAIGNAVGSGTPWYNLYIDGSGNLAQYAPGTSGYVLTSNGPTAAPSWQAAASPLPTFTSQEILFGDGTNTPATSSSFTFDNTGKTLSVGTGTENVFLQLGGPSAVGQSHINSRSGLDVIANGLLNLYTNTSDSIILAPNYSTGFELTPALNGYFYGTGALQLHSGTTAQRPSPTAGMIRYNTDIAALEAYQGGSWTSLGSTAYINNVSNTGTIDLTVTTGDLTADIVSDSITNSLINSSAAIDFTKMAAMTASRVPISDASGFLVPSTVTSTTLGYLDATSSIQTQLNGKQATGNYITALTGDVTASGPGSAAATIANNAVTNAKAAQMPTLTLKGNNTGSTANAADLTVSQVNTMLGTLSNPMTAAGQMIYGGASGAPTAVAAGTTGQYLKSNGTSAPTFTSFVQPTIQRFTSGSGTYTTPAGVVRLRVTVIGGGGGGGGAQGTGGSPTSGGAGSSSTFGTSLLTAAGGSSGATGGTSSGGNGGGYTINAPAIEVYSAVGGAGMTANIGLVNGYAPGGNGGDSMLGGGGRGGGLAGTGGSGAANTGGGGGAGGGGAGNSAGVGSAAGGGAGGSLVAIINSPSSTYSYAVGGGGSGGTGGTGGGSGSNGGAGVVVVEEFYQ